MHRYMYIPMKKSDGNNFHLLTVLLVFIFPTLTNMISYNLTLYKFKVVGRLTKRQMDRQIKIMCIPFLTLISEGIKN